ncbi:MurR/RpiR family transcriptional regulator [Paratractidigestivibacter sp.]|uniref:MurR/RpiR family transcriptional regulator n=1 Tax=Paratractidigestivibacter sp. TaxID=2847316 RepID=UPI002ABD9D1B|nr:MurR/RpiR family transcriptional regulator [Paratractidigestivibacter sp.]
MDIRRRLREAKGLTPTESQLAGTVLAMGERIQGASIKELAAASATSVATVHRLCKKLGVEGLKELKVELARAAARGERPADVDFDFPFDAGWGAERVAAGMKSLYAEAIEETLEALDAEALGRVADLVRGASVVDVYTESHNLYPAQMFVDRLLSAGRSATCHEGQERKIRTALTSDASHVAVLISYSGVNLFFPQLLPVLAERGVPTVLIGAPMARDRNPGLAEYLLIGDSESTLHRITQFASHISVQFVLDTLYSCVIAGDYERSIEFIRSTLPYTRKPGL